MIIAETPKEIPIIENHEKIEIYPSLFLENRNLLTNNLSEIDNIMIKN